MFLISSHLMYIIHSSLLLVNINAKHHVRKLFQSNLDAQHTAIIFHCEFSQNRGPKSCKYFRELDRAHNVYPQLVRYINTTSHTRTA